MKNVVRKVKFVPRKLPVAGVVGLVLGCLLTAFVLWLWPGCVGARSASAGFSADELQVAAGNTRNAARMLAGHLGYGANGQGWKRVLKFDELEAQLRNGPSTQVDLPLLTDVVNQLSQNYPQLEGPQYTDIRRALSDLRVALSMYVKMLQLSGPVTENSDQVAAQQQIVR
jgi:hypothetical protein